MLIWKGWGIVNVIVVFLMSLLSSLIQNAIYGENNSQPGWIFSVFLILSGAIVWFLGNFFNRNANTIYINETTGQQHRLGNQHTLFFIPMQYWAFIIGAVGIYSFFTPEL